MLHSVFFFLLSIAQPATNVSQCETYAPRLDGISVTVCACSVVRACDVAGNCTSRRR